MSISTPPRHAAPGTEPLASQADGAATPASDNVHPDPEALIEEAWERTRRRRRRQCAAVAVTLVCAAVGVGIAHGSLTGRSAAGGRPRAGAGAGTVRVGGDYWYTRAVLSDREPLPIVPRIMRVGQKPGPVPLVYFNVRMSIETWIGQDGTVRQRQLQLSRTFASAAGRRRWDAARQTFPGGLAGTDVLAAGDTRFPVSANVPSGQGGDPGDGLFTFAQLLRLPLAPAALRVVLEHAESALARRGLDAYVRPGPRHARAVARLMAQWAQNQEQLYTLSQLLESPLPNRLRLALVGAVARMPGVTIARNPPAGRIVLTQRNERESGLTVDAASGRLIAFGPSRVTAQGPTSSTRSLPAGIKPIRGDPRVPAPVPVTVTPSAGGAGTAFSIEIPRPAISSSSATAPFLQAMLFGPTGPDCTFWNSHPPTAIVPPGRPTTVEGQPGFRYQLLPTAIKRARWCPGRYQLQVTPLSPAGGTARALAGPSATYFTVAR